MSARRWMWKTIRRTAIEIIGWTLIVLGIAALFLPGPGMLLLFLGTAFLAKHYVWATKIVDYLEHHAMRAAREGVESWWRIIVGFIGGTFMIVTGAIWAYGPYIGVYRVEIFGIEPFTVGPKLPLEGWIGSYMLMAGGVMVWLILLESMRRFGKPGSQPRSK